MLTHNSRNVYTYDPNSHFSRSTYYMRNIYHNSFDCKKCGVIFAYRTKAVYCTLCQAKAMRLVRWWRRCKNKRKIMERLMVLNVMSSRMSVSEMGINDHVMSFL